MSKLFCPITRLRCDTVITFLEKYIVKLTAVDMAVAFISFKSNAMQQEEYMLSGAKNVYAIKRYIRSISFPNQT